MSGPDRDAGGPKRDARSTAPEPLVLPPVPDEILNAEVVGCEKAQRGTYRVVLKEADGKKYRYTAYNRMEGTYRRIVVYPLETRGANPDYDAWSEVNMASGWKIVSAER